MSQADRIPAWAASPEEFETTLEALVSTAAESGVEFDRAWTFRRDDSTCDDVMIEITRLKSRPELADPEPSVPTAMPDKTTTSDFESALDDLLVKGQEAGLSFDRSWTFRNPDPDRDDVMVEVSRLAKPS